MLLPALPVVILWAVLPLAALAVLRGTTLPRLTSALTLASGLLALIAISLPHGTMTTMMQRQPGDLMVHDMVLGAALTHYLIGLAMTLFGAGGLVLLISGLAQGAMAGMVTAIGALGLLMFYLAAGLQVAQQTLSPQALTAAAQGQMEMMEMMEQASTVSALGFLAGAGLIILLFALTLVSLFKRG